MNSKIDRVGTLLERFTRKYIIMPSGCWEWQATKNTQGRGFIAIHSKPVQAHRVSYQLFRGEIPKGLCVLHTCDNGGCVNPDHLWLGTQLDNRRDCINKGRAYFPSFKGKKTCV
jgi:HNH endonuclease